METQSALDDARGRRRGRGRPRGRRRRLRRAARAARQLDHLPGRRGRRQRHPLRAAGGRARRPRAGSTACSTRLQRIPSGMAPGVTTRLKVLAKLDIAERRKPQDGRISLNAAAVGRLLDIRVADAADGRGRVGRDAPARQVAEDPDARGARPLRGDARPAPRDHPQADRRPARHRADRLGQVDDALRRARRDQPARDQHHHRRGSGRVPAGRDQPGADQPARPG